MVKERIRSYELSGYTKQNGKRIKKLLKKSEVELAKEGSM